VPLFTLLDREFDAIDKFLQSNPQFGGYAEGCALNGTFHAPHDDMAADHNGGTCLELECSGRQLETAGITFSPKGVIYRVTALGP
jgi:hypothetical protein